MTSHGKWTPGDLTSTEVTTGFDVIRELGYLRTETSVVMTAIPTGELTARVAADFAARCDQMARAVLRLEQAQHQPDVIDEQLQSAAVDLHRDQVRRGYFSNSGAGSPPPPVVG